MWTARSDSLYRSSTNVPSLRLSNTQHNYAPTMCLRLRANTKSHDGHILHASSPHTIRVNPDLPTAAPPVALASRYALAPPAIHVTQKRTPRGPCHGCLATHGVDVVDDHPERQHTSRLHTHEAGTAPRRRECAARGVSHHTVPLLHPGGALVTHSSMRQVIHGTVWSCDVTAGRSSG